MKSTRPEDPTIIKQAPLPPCGQAVVVQLDVGFHVQTCGDALISALQQVASYSKINLNYGAGGSWRRMSSKAETNAT